jgi:hypothetical protein
MNALEMLAAAGLDVDALDVDARPDGRITVISPGYDRRIVFGREATAADGWAWWSYVIDEDGWRPAGSGWDLAEDFGAVLQRALGEDATKKEEKTDG